MCGSAQMPSKSGRDDAVLSRYGIAVLAAELIPIIGETGFATLFARSLYRNQTLFTWLASAPAPQQPQVLQHSATQFTTLKASLQTRSFTEATAANQALLITFTDILIVLIGEPLTIGILRAASGNDASEITNKELPHE